MRYKPGHKEQARKILLQAVGRKFRAQGYAAVGVNALAKAAEVTSGAFYSHFPSKASAFKAALIEGLNEVIESIPLLQQEHGARWVQIFSEYYLGRAHCDDLEGGCAMATLTPEVARANESVQQVYQEKMTQIANLVALGLAGGTKKSRVDRGWAMLSILIGGLNVARAMQTSEQRASISTAIIVGAVNAAGKAKAEPRGHA